MLRSLDLLATAFVLGGLVGCARSPDDGGAGRPSPEPLAGGLEVRMTFDDRADLDLFVTDPLKETVYFGNNPSKGGGELLRDARCGEEVGREEVVRFPRPRPGTYRVGIDYSTSCRFRREPATYHVRAEAGDLVREATGTIEPGRFESLVLEFTLPETPR